MGQHLIMQRGEAGGMRNHPKSLAPPPPPGILNMAPGPPRVPGVGKGCSQLRLAPGLETGCAASASRDACVGGRLQSSWGGGLSSAHPKAPANTRLSVAPKC